MSDRKPSAPGEDGKSCAAGAVGSCVALLCCPCAAVSCIVLSCCKLPLAMVRCCMGRSPSPRREEAGGTEMVETMAPGAGAGEGAEELGLELADFGIGHMGFGTFSYASSVNSYTEGD